MPMARDEAVVDRATTDRETTLQSPSTRTIPSAVTANTFLPKRSHIAYKTITRKNGTSRRISVKNTQPIDCTQFMYDPTYREQKSPYIYDNSITSIVTLPLEGKQIKPTIKMILGNIAQIHVNTENIFLTEPKYFPQKFACPVSVGVACRPRNGNENYTTVYGFNINTL